MHFSRLLEGSQHTNLRIKSRGSMLRCQRRLPRPKLEEDKGIRTTSPIWPHVDTGQTEARRGELHSRRLRIKRHLDTKINKRFEQELNE